MHGVQGMDAKMKKTGDLERDSCLCSRTVGAGRLEGIVMGGNREDIEVTAAIGNRTWKRERIS